MLSIQSKTIHTHVIFGTKFIHTLETLNIHVHHDQSSSNMVFYVQTYDSASQNVTLSYKHKSNSLTSLIIYTRLTSPQTDLHKKQPGVE